MNILTKFELKKIVRNKRTIYVLLGMIVLNILAFFIIDFSYTRAFIPNEKSYSLKILTGFDAIRYDREINEKYSGMLTDKKAQSLDSDLLVLKQDLKGYSEDDTTCIMNSYINQQAILKNLKNQDGTLKPVSKVYPFSLRLGYSAGWKGMVGSYSGVMTLILCIIIIVCISPVFTEEYEWQTDPIIRSSRFGKSKLIWAKIRASFLCASAFYFAFAFLNFCLYGAVYGLDGSDCAIQSSAVYSDSGYSMTFLELWLCTLIMGLIGLFCLTAIILFISAASKRSMTSMICSALVVLAPLFFDFSDSYPIIQKYIELAPIYMMHTSGIFKKIQIYSGIIQPIVMTAIALCSIFIFCKLTYHVFLKHQQY